MNEGEHGTGRPPSHLGLLDYAGWMEGAEGCPLGLECFAHDVAFR